MVYVDKLQTQDLHLGEAQIEVIENCRSLFASQKIHQFKISEFNFGTKQAFWNLLEWGFEGSQNVIYLEDDLVLIDDPTEYIKQALAILNTSQDHALACLFSRTIHSSPSGNLSRTSSWPELWGVLIPRLEYQELNQLRNSLNKSDVRDTVRRFSRNELAGILTKLLRKRFENIWFYKYSKSLSSLYAWDTELQLILWKQNRKVLLPLKPLLADTGVDPTSISQGKLAVGTVACTRVIHHFGESCPRCERRRESSNNLFSWKLLIRFILAGRFK